VKQWCVFRQFIVINGNLKVDARVFISNNQDGEESKTAERQRERVCVCERDGVSLKVKDSVGHKMDSWRKHLVMDVDDILAS
jgi:hypothetical protein